MVSSYVVSGFTANIHSGARDTVFEYDPATGAWRSPRRLLPRGLGRGSGAPAASSMRSAGAGPISDGCNPRVFDPASGKWSPAAPLPAARDHLAVVAAAGKPRDRRRTSNNTTDNTARPASSPAIVAGAAAPMPAAQCARARPQRPNPRRWRRVRQQPHVQQNEAYDTEPIAGSRWSGRTPRIGGASLGDGAYFAGGNEVVAA
jgi:hypothetical protein